MRPAAPVITVLKHLVKNSQVVNIFQQYGQFIHADDSAADLSLNSIFSINYFPLM